LRASDWRELHNEELHNLYCSSDIKKKKNQNEGDHQEERSADGGIILKEILKK
jgi:hypothetical protein